MEREKRLALSTDTLARVSLYQLSYSRMVTAEAVIWWPGRNRTTDTRIFNSD